MKLINKLLGARELEEKKKLTHGLTDVGRERAANEDYFRVIPEKSLFIVADGMGGHNAGEVASRNATQTVDAFFSLDLLPTIKGDHDKIKAAMLESLNRAHREVLRIAKTSSSLEGMGCTIVAAFICEDILHLGHVGDARAYVSNAGGIQLLTHDHSYVMEMVDKGKMTMDEARVSPLKNRLNQAIGASVDIQPAYRRFVLTDGDRILLCSDGLWDMLADEEIHRALMLNLPAKTICENLIKMANDAGGHDNITALVVLYKKESPAIKLQDSGEFVDTSGEYSYVFKNNNDHIK